MSDPLHQNLEILWWELHGDVLKSTTADDQLLFSCCVVDKFQQMAAISYIKSVNKQLDGDTKTEILNSEQIEYLL